MYSHNYFPCNYTWEDLKSDWFFLLFIKFLKKNLLYKQVAELCLSPLRRGEYSILSEAHSRNYYPDKLFFGTLFCTLPKGILDENGYHKYEKKWSQFIWENRNVIPKEIRDEIGFFQGDFEHWFLEQYEYRFGEDLFWKQIKDNNVSHTSSGKYTCKLIGNKTL